MHVGAEQPSRRYFMRQVEGKPTPDRMLQLCRESGDENMDDDDGYRRRLLA
jgi:hypothetical protein